LRHRVSIGLRTFFIRPCGEPPGFGQSHPFRVSTPARSHAFGQVTTRAMRSPRAEKHITAFPQRSLNR
jgi:hypothetical protein